jgi:hypothetical protein
MALKACWVFGHWLISLNPIDVGKHLYHKHFSVDRPSSGGKYSSSLLNPLVNSYTVESRFPRSQHPARAMSAQYAVADSRTGSTPRIGDVYMCECCPKKPKKIENEEQLQ